MDMLRSRSYVQLLVLAAIIGAPVSALSYGFLKFVSLLTGVDLRVPAQRAGLLAGAGRGGRYRCWP